MGSPGNVGALGLRSGPAASGTESLPPGTTERVISMCHGSPQACPLIPKMGLAPRSICIWDLPWRGRTEQSHWKDRSQVLQITVSSPHYWIAPLPLEVTHSLSSAWCHQQVPVLLLDCPRPTPNVDSVSLFSWTPRQFIFLCPFAVAHGL